MFDEELDTLTFLDGYGGVRTVAGPHPYEQEGFHWRARVDAHDRVHGCEDTIAVGTQDHCEVARGVASCVEMPAERTGSAVLYVEPHAGTAPLSERVTE